MTEELAPGTIIAEKLRVIRVLGAGGMGAVYEVEHSYTKHRRALKMLHPQFAELSTTVKRFLREASAAGHIQNPHIVETFDAGTLDDGTPYLVMELLEGRSLAELLAEQGRLGVSEAVSLLTQACDGVQAAHEAGVVHRDLKPENLFIVAGQSPFVKILDFGISKFDEDLKLGDALTREGSLLGTPYYMAPEQLIERRAATVASDVYSLGVIAYECLAGGRPFEGESLPELSVRVASGSCTPVEERAPRVPPALARAIRRAMERDPEQRFASARAFGNALANSLEPESPDGPAGSAAPTQAAEPSGPPRAATVAARTQRPAAPTPTGAPARRGWLVALISVVVALGAYWWSRGPASTNAESASAAVSAEAVRAAQPSATTPPSNTSETDSAPPAVSIEPNHPAPRVVPPAARTVAPGSSGSRSENHQLSNENPY